MLVRRILHIQINIFLFVVRVQALQSIVSLIAQYDELLDAHQR